MPFPGNRILASATAHFAVLLAAASLRSSLPVRPAAAREQVTILAPGPMHPPPAQRPVPRPPHAPAPTAPRPFEAPALRRAVVRQAAIEIQLDEAAVATPAAVSAPLMAALPPPPVLLGRLATVEASIAARPASHAVRPANFEAGAAEPAPEPARTPARSAGFGDVSAAAAARSQPEIPQSATTPVQILAKPRPVYTEEARRLRIEGEVVLQVLFTATGQVQVESVLRGLGHGLDEAAAESARDIRFRPATRAGQPVSQRAAVHISFQLAY